MKRTGIPLRTNAQRYAFIGALFGLLFPIFATLIYLLDTKLSFGMTSILAAYSKEPLLWMIVTAPIFLGIFAAIAGRRQDDLEKANHALQSRERELQATQLILEQRVDERTQELTAMNQLIMERGEQLEDRIVKQTFRALSAGSGGELEIFTKRPQLPTDEEIERNPRSRSAKLRVIQRVVKEGHA